VAAPRNPNAGVGLAEALVAVAVSTTVAVGVAPMLFVAGGAVSYARDQTMTTALAAAKLDELEALEWGYRTAADGTLEPTEDITTNLSLLPPDTSGAGLSTSPSDALLVNTPGYVDFLDARGRWVGTGTVSASGARYVRRWSVARWARDPEHCLLLRVVAATTSADAVDGPRTDSRSRRADTWVFSLKTRMRP
jgi:hypothetical protein